MARQGGVLVRSGHTEAGTGLATLAGLPPVGLLAELVNDNGYGTTLAKVVGLLPPPVENYAVADLIAYRQQREKLVGAVLSSRLKPIGDAQAFAYRTILKMQNTFAGVRRHPSMPSVPCAYTAKTGEDQAGAQAIIQQRVGQHKIELTSNGGVLIYLRTGFGCSARLQLPRARRRATQRMTRVGVGAQILQDRV